MARLTERIWRSAYLFFAWWSIADSIIAPNCATIRTLIL